MKIREIIKVMLLPRWGKKDIADAARGFANAGCDDSPEVELKAFLDIAYDNFQSGYWGFWTYVYYYACEIGRAISK